MLGIELRMSKYLIKRAEKHKVSHSYRGRDKDYFKVVNEKNKEHNVTLKFTCDCLWGSNQGTNGKICSHVLAAIKKIANEGKIK